MTALKSHGGWHRPALLAGGAAAGVAAAADCWASGAGAADAVATRFDSGLIGRLDIEAWSQDTPLGKTKGLTESEPMSALGKKMA